MSPHPLSRLAIMAAAFTFVAAGDAQASPAADEAQLLLDDWQLEDALEIAQRMLREHPDDPDLPEITRRVHASRETYLKWGRDTLGWAVYLFRMPA